MSPRHWYFKAWLIVWAAVWAAVIIWAGSVKEPTPSSVPYRITSRGSCHCCHQGVTLKEEFWQ